jgi:hypothetical protein
VKNWVNHPASNLAGYSPRNPVRNLVSYLGGYPASNRAGYSPENPASYSGSYWGGNSASYSADCADNRWERNPEGNRERNGADYSESYPADSLPNYSESHPESFDHKPVTCRTTGRIDRRTPTP